MFIQSIELHNIRSYSRQKIDFSKGITVLSGDIGSGKSSILMAVEFALFGILRGKTSATEFLKHGEKEGWVELRCEINNKDVLIRRSLKRTSTSVAQKEGTLSINGETESLTPVELKARILELLGYPGSLLNTSTNLFRYTVYTPQEQVKLILHESPEERKDIIRKIFDIDKYNRVAENISYYISDVRERIQRLKGQTDDVKTLQEQLAAQRKEIERYEKTLPEKKTLWETKKKELENAEKEFKAIQETRQNFKKEKEVLEILKRNIETTKKNQERIQKDLSILQENLAKKEVTKLEPLDETRKEKIRLNKEKIFQARQELNKQLGELEAKQKQARQLEQKIQSLDFCPTCQQKVGAEHKEHIHQEQQKELQRAEEKQKKITTLLETLREKEQLIAEKEEEYRKLEQQHVLAKEKQKRSEEQAQQQQNLLERTKELEEELKKQEQEFQVKQEQFSPEKFQKITEDYAQKEREIITLRQEERRTNDEANRTQTALDIAKKMAKQLEEGLLEKTKIEKRIQELAQIKEWVSNLFTPLVKTIERRVLSKVYYEFNQNFIEWFSILIDDDSFAVQLNEDFTPLIEQNGFDTNITNLSGGEKTALALAYRLALNKVLNTYFGTLHTKDLLVLDEPTEGFSTEQIDRLREVLFQLKLSQLIIVSHEQKIESLADKIIRVEKIHNQTQLR